MSEWERCASWVQSALDAGGNIHGLGDVEFLVATGQAQLWPGLASAVVTRVEVFPRDKWLTVWLAGGDLAELRDELLPKIEAFGKSQGCSKSVVFGRLGWSKALSGDGYAPLAVVIGKAL